MAIRSAKLVWTELTPSRPGGENSVAAEETLSFSSEIRQSLVSKSLTGLFRFLPPATRAELLGGSALIVISLLAATWAFQCRSDALALERDAMMIDGNVVRLWVTSGNNGRHYRVAYEYPVAVDRGAPLLQGEGEIPQKDFD